MSLLTGASSANAAMPFAIYNYIPSYDLYYSLENEIGIKEYYSLHGLDFITSLDQSSSRESLHEYWQWMVTIIFDESTGIFTLKVKAYSPEKAHEITEAILRKCEDLVNTINDKRSLDSLTQARVEIDIAEKRLLGAQVALQAFQDQYTELDPESTATSRVSIIAKLEGELALAEAELAAARSFMRADSLSLKSLESRVTGLREQIAEERSRLTEYDDEKFTEVIAKYESLMLEHEFARNQYTSAMGAMEAARIQNEANTGFLVTVQKPTLPEESTYPKRLLYAFLSVVIVFMAYSLIALIIASIKEHGVFNA